MSDGYARSESDRDRFYVQLDKHPTFQAWGKDDETSPLPTLKDAFVFAACVGWVRERRLPLVKRQHVGFWRTFDTRDSTLLYAIAIAETGDPSVVADQGAVIQIAEEYANGGIDLLLAYDRADRDRTLVALAGFISGTERGMPEAAPMETSAEPPSEAVVEHLADATRIEVADDLEEDPDLN
jgi:dnd system-associated protein 4